MEKFLPNNEPQSIINFPFYWVTQVNGKYLQLMERSIKKLGLDNTKRKIILSTNSVGEASITEIANLSLLKLTTTTKAVYRLVEDDILEVSSSKEDERVSVVKLTSKGLELVAQLNQIIAVTLSGVLQQFEEEELTLLNQQLKKMAELIPSNWFYEHKNVCDKSHIRFLMQYIEFGLQADTLNAFNKSTHYL